MSSLSELRREFSGDKLNEESVGKSPVAFFNFWLEESLSKLTDANSFVLSTVDKVGQPQSRVLLLKDFSEEGFVFYTNYGSDKGKDLSNNPRASMLFFWQDLFRQVKINGYVEKISQAESEQYFATRPRSSKLGALASNQSARVEAQQLQASFIEVENAYAGKDEIPKPEEWGGYILKPNYFEFWQGQASRFHDRICFEKSKSNKGVWQIFRLAP